MNKKSIPILALSLIIFSGCASKNTGTTVGAVIGAGVAATGVASPYGLALVAGGGLVGCMLSGE